MSNIKITIEVINNCWVPRHGNKYFTGVPCADMSRKRFIKKVKEDHLNWIITNDVLETPSIPQSKHPVLEQDHFDAPSLDDILKPKKVEVIDKETGEISDIEAQLLREASNVDFNNSLKQENMEDKKVKTKRSKFKVVTSKAIGLGTYTIGSILHASLQTTGDIFHAAAKGVRNVEAFIIDKAGATPEGLSRSDVKQGIELRTALIQGYATYPFDFVKDVLTKKSGVSMPQTEPAV